MSTPKPTTLTLKTIAAVFFLLGSASAFADGSLVDGESLARRHALTWSKLGGGSLLTTVGLVGVSYGIVKAFEPNPPCSFLCMGLSNSLYGTLMALTAAVPLVIGAVMMIVAIRRLVALQDEQLSPSSDDPRLLAPPPKPLPAAVPMVPVMSF